MSPRKFTVLHSIRVVMAIGWSDFVLKYRGSFFGYLWSLAGPLVKFGVILLVFGPYVEGQIPYYRLYLFLGIIIWEHFTATTNGCIAMLDQKSSIIQRHPFPRYLLIFAVGWTNFIVFCTHIVVFGFFCVALGLPWTMNVSYLLITMIEMTLLTLGIGMIFASYSLLYRDIAHLWSMLTPVLFWLTPIMYPPAQSGSSGIGGVVTLFTNGGKTLSSIMRQFIDLQPLSIIIHDARRALLYPDLWGMPTLGHTAITLIITGTIFLLGLSIFLSREGSFLQEY